MNKIINLYDKMLKFICNIEIEHYNFCYLISIKLFKKLVYKKLHGKLINKIKKELKMYPKKMLTIKPDEWMTQLICKDKNKDLYIVVCGTSPLTNWKVINSSNDKNIAALIKVYSKYYKFNLPIHKGFFRDNSPYVVYKYFGDLKVNLYDNKKEYDNMINIAKDVFKNAEEYEINPENIDDFAYGTIKYSIFVDKSLVQKSESYRYYKELLLKKRYVKVALQHCDYSMENVMINSCGEKYLMDLERVCPLHLASYDWYHLERKLNGWERDLHDENIPYCEILNALVKVFYDLLKYT